MALQISVSDAHLKEPQSSLSEFSIVSVQCHSKGVASCDRMPRVSDEASAGLVCGVGAVASTAKNCTSKVVSEANPAEMTEGNGAVSFAESPLGIPLKSVILGSSDVKTLESSLDSESSSPAVANSSASNTVNDAQPSATFVDVDKASGTVRHGNHGIPCDKSGPAYPTGPASSRSWGLAAYERLLGGGENGANGGNWGPTSGVGGGAWGPNQWGAAAASAGNRSAPPSQGQQQAQVAQSMPQGGGWKNPADNSSVSTSSGGSPNGNNNNVVSSSAKDPNLREVLYSVDGWCSNNVNQDTQWDVPQSPGLPEKEVPMWKQTASNGTEFWEASVRNAGQAPVQPPQPKAPWGHTPSTNIGGTWGEEDDSADSSNTWGHLGASAAPGPGPVGPSAAPMWTGGPKKEPEWTAGGPQGAGGWGGVPRMSDPEVASMGPANHWGNPVKAPTGQWGTAVGPKDVPSWGDQSPPAQKRILSKQEDGTAAWGNPTQQQAKSHWQEMPVTNIGGRAMQPPGPPPSRGPHGPGLKDLPMWGPPRNGSWGSEASVGDSGSSIWMDGKGWNEPQTPTWGGGPGPKPRTPTTPGAWTGEPEMLDPSSWGQPPKQTSKNLSKEAIWASKQFRILSEMGFKKDDVENALRASGMVMEDALEMLHAGRVALGGWRPPGEDHGIVFDPVGPPGGHFPPGGQRFGGHQQMAFGHPGASMGIGGFGAGSGLLQKSLPQQPPPLPQAHMFGVRGGSSRDLGMGGGQPSPAQLRGLVQQIQMAVHAGHLNPQILNQPLAPQTLILLNQLLQQLKILQQLSNQQAALGVRPSMGAGGPAVQLMQQIAKTKQQIGNLQSQITTQQAIYMKQQQGQYMPSQQPPGAPPTQGGLDLHSKFDQMSLQDGQSRLTQWKRTSPMDKSDLEMEFSRAPGANSAGSKPALSSSLSSPNLNPLLGHGEGAWSSLSRSQSDSGWPEAATSDLTTPTTVEVPEFKPGEPWKGPLAKSIEDDPTLTPAKFMGSDPFPGGGGKSSSPPASGGAGGASSASDALSSSTWSFNSASAAGVQTGSKFGQSDLWGAPKLRGPPPGISAAGKYGSAAGSWSGALSGNSPWLVLRNLTPQIDGSTLKTLCAQHGPVQNFHLNLNQGVAFVRYSSSDEAAKAQGALNNCVLGNTTILADLANESEVQGWLQQLGMPPQQPQQSAPGGGVGGGNWSVRGSTPSSGSGSTKSGSTSGAVDSWASPGPSTSPMWSSASGSVWSSTFTERGNGAGSSLNASLNSLLPGDLLGNESM